MFIKWHSCLPTDPKWSSFNDGLLRVLRLPYWFILYWTLMIFFEIRALLQLWKQTLIVCLLSFQFTPQEDKRQIFELLFVRTSVWKFLVCASFSISVSILTSFRWCLWIMKSYQVGVSCVLFLTLHYIHSNLITFIYFPFNKCAVLL